MAEDTPKGGVHLRGGGKSRTKKEVSTEIF